MGKGIQYEIQSNAADIQYEAGGITKGIVYFKRCGNRAVIFNCGGIDICLGDENDYDVRRGDFHCEYGD